MGKNHCGPNLAEDRGERLVEAYRRERKIRCQRRPTSGPPLEKRTERFEVKREIKRTSDLGKLFEGGTIRESEGTRGSGARKLSRWRESVKERQILSPGGK